MGICILAIDILAIAVRAIIRGRRDVVGHSSQERGIGCVESSNICSLVDGLFGGVYLKKRE